MIPPFARPRRIPKHVCYTLVLLYFSSPSVAAPIRDSSTASSWLACLTALLLFSVICLSAFKLLFVRHRRVNNLKRPASPLVDSRSRFKLPGSAARIISKNVKAGFLIGLFGSPSFEIRSKPSEIALIYPGTSKSSQKLDLSSDTSTTNKSKNSDFSTGPIIFFSKKSPRYIHGEESRSGFLSSASHSKSFFSFPTRLSFDLGRVRRKKKQVQVLNFPQKEGLSWPHNRLEHATLRLVKTYTDPDTSLPLYHNLNIPESSGPGPTLPPHSLVAAYLNRSPPVPLQSLPSLPAKEYLEHQGDGLLGNASFDHPYNNHLINLVKPGRQKSRRASLSPNLSVINEACQSFPDSSHELGIGDTLPDVCGLAQLPFVLDPVKNLPLPYKACDALRRRERVNTRPSSIRNPRSPPLGPSPLRSMLFPASVIEEPKCATDNGAENVSTVKRMSVQSRRLSFDLSKFKQYRKHSKDPRRNSSEGRESIVDILQELAEETKDWDESIVMDESFKAMIKRPQAILSYTSFDGANADPTSKALPPIQTSPKFVSFWAEDSPPPKS